MGRRNSTHQHVEDAALLHRRQQRAHDPELRALRVDLHHHHHVRLRVAQQAQRVDRRDADGGVAACELAVVLLDVVRLVRADGEGAPADRRRRRKKKEDPKEREARAGAE